MLERRRFLLDWSANFVSLGFLAVAGVLINSLITKYYGAAALGVFNQVFAIYILGSQAATAGVQYSVLRYVPEAANDRTKVAEIIYTALCASMITASVVVILAWLTFKYIGVRLYSPAVADGVVLMLPGLWCFAINKILLNALNGLQFNSLLATFTALRYALMSVCAIAAIQLGALDYQMPVILSVSEGILLLALALCFVSLFGKFAARPTLDWAVLHLGFGLRSILGGVAVELNTRIDVLILGLFTSNDQVGVYSFAAFFVEGLLQLPQVSRRIVDPVLAKLVTKGETEMLAAFLRKGRNLGAGFMLLVSVAFVAFYPKIAIIFGNREMADTSWSVFSILMGGACVFGSYATFSGLLSQAGLPAAQSNSNVVILLTNALLNFLLVPGFGIKGAAFATGVSFVIGTLYFRRLVWRNLGIRF